MPEVHLRSRSQITQASYHSQLSDTSDKLFTDTVKDLFGSETLFVFSLFKVSIISASNGMINDNNRSSE